eukprot:CAMPEP_0196574610 /NCGR_PEP_ID=MMETSP1081-20130531/4293_1 /TAXON_ID=36882 /ORGANISM="Pyramimonas amylifera, Strain CCMP720" /LENGTH=85 /DNA_ID=CAMNT_0041892693 /DNA_START=282 /DNA_END=539 /DNA_ORIENTATION=-
MSEYQIADGGKYIVGVEPKTALNDVVASFEAKFGKPASMNIMSAIGMFSSTLNNQQIVYLMGNPHVKYVECDSPVHIMELKSKDL